ncbi:MAG: peptide chain release factor N(5)-glutamine methyltransferase [Candidatus Cloacimonetes bacterium]|nr:peptide chain release factor N(5)-glutamine methyltransferase [Candidatus Cloacimonadota bacterium]
MSFITISQALTSLTSLFQAAALSKPSLQAEHIIAAVTGIPRLELHLNRNLVLTSEQLSEIKQKAERRAEHEPLQYILGETEFYGARILVTPDVLIPRPETEYLVDWVASEYSEEQTLLDLGTGSGCIAIALGLIFPNMIIEAADISAQALETARKNAEINCVKINFHCSDLFEELRNKYQIIISNPPYISTQEYQELDREIRDYEPQEALLAGEGGLYYYRRILAEAKDYLLPGGRIYLEIGAQQGKAIKKIAENYGWQKIEIRSDLSGCDRYVRIGN